MTSPKNAKIFSADGGSGSLVYAKSMCHSFPGSDHGAPHDGAHAGGVHVGEDTVQSDGTEAVELLALTGGEHGQECAGLRSPASSG